MSKHELHYKLSPGETIVYEKEINLLVEEPTGEKHYGTLAEKMTQKVIGYEDPHWEVNLELNFLSSEGPLCPEPPDELKHQSQSFFMDKTGTLFMQVGQQKIAKSAGFPAEALEAGQSWISQNVNPEDQSIQEVHFTLEKFEEKDGEVVATIVSHTNSVNPADETTQETQASVLFSITKGHQISSTSVIKTSWKNGQTSQAVVEVKIKERG